MKQSVFIFFVFKLFCLCKSSSLEERVQELESSVRNLTKSIEECKDSAVYKREGNSHDPVIAFSATISSSITPVASYENIVFNNVILNTGNAYNPNVGRFQAPVSGTYHFVATIMSYSGHYIEIEMVKNAQILCRARGSETYTAMGTCVANVHMTAGSDVWIRHYSSNGNYIYGNNFPSFAGHLIKAD